MSDPHAIEADIAARLQTHTLGRAVTFFPRMDSTNTYALKLAGEPAVLHGRLFVADSQSAGRGRHGRAWLSKPSEDLLFTLLLCPPEPRFYWPLLTQMAALAVVTSLRKSADATLAIRWPNDVLANGRKICGALTETTGANVAIGIGVNINSLAAERPDEIADIAVSLRDLNGAPSDRWEVLAEFMAEFERLYDQFENREFEALADAIRREIGSIGRMLRARLADREVIGTAIDYEDTGALVLRLESGETVRLTGGEAIEIKPAEGGN